jgi:hypothetical protein
MEVNLGVEGVEIPSEVVTNFGFCSEQRENMKTGEAVPYGQLYSGRSCLQAFFGKAK